MYLEALEIRRRLSKVNPQAYEPNVAMTLNNLGNLYSNLYRYKDCASYSLEALKTYRHLAQSNPQRYDSQVIQILGNLSFYSIFTKQFVEAEQYAREALSMDSTKTWIATNLAAALLFQGKFTEAEAIYRQYKDEKKNSFLQDFDDFEAAEIIPEERKADVERIRKLLNE